LVYGWVRPLLTVWGNPIKFDGLGVLGAFVDIDKSAQTHYITVLSRIEHTKKTPQNKKYVSGVFSFFALTPADKPDKNKYSPPKMTA